MTSGFASRLRRRTATVVPDAGWRRMVLLRRLAAAVLAGTAVVLALAPAENGRVVPVVVAAADLAAGATVTASDLAVRSWPGDLVPAGALRAPAAAEGRVLAGAARAGEPLTDLRLTGAGSRATDPNSAAVPVRLADPDVAELLGPGSRVDVVTAADPDGAPAVLAADASVLAVLPAEDGPAGPSLGRLILIAVPRELATRVAAAAVADQLAVTLR
jgi:Flp pilus assembly protein CpaB